MDNFDIVVFFRFGSYVAAAVAGILLILAVVLFFKMKILDVIRELSGKSRADLTAKMTSSYGVTGSLRRSASSAAAESANSPETRAETKTGQIGKTGQISHARKVNKTPKPKTGQPGARFEITKDVAVIHTSERIQSA
ncbi:MAG: hypothetical protein IJL26_05745 [Clostridia bacterium]|nr:hypothetical protein [Clostridia bacterium]